VSDELSFASLFSSGQIVYVALVAIVLEAAALAWLRRQTGAGLEMVDVVGNLLAGAFLLLALQAALSGAPWTHTAVFMTASFPAHLYDLGRRARFVRTRSKQ
jgi:hypothetical protein